MRARIRDTTIYFDVDGMGLVPDGDRMVDRPVLFVLHGGPGADHSYLKLRMAPLTDSAQLVYLDHRGAGRSDRGDASEWTLANHAADVDALRQHLGLERIVLFGTSYGGFVSQQFARWQLESCDLRRLAIHNTSSIRISREFHLHLPVRRDCENCVKLRDI